MGKIVRFWSMAKQILSTTSRHIFQQDCKFPYASDNKSTRWLNEYWNPFSTGTLSENSNNSTKFKLQQLENHKCKVYQPESIRKVIKYSFKNVTVMIMFTLTIFKILLFLGRSVLSPAQQSAGSERAKLFS